MDILRLGTDPILHFEAIARLKSLKLAAQELGLSQPAVTHSLRRLEQSLGVKLCVRSRAGFALTEPGQRLLRAAARIKAELMGYQRFLQTQAEFDGLLSVGILGATYCPSFDAALGAVTRAFPKLQLNLQVYTSEEIERLVHVGALEVGLGLFSVQRPRLPHLEYAEVAKERIRHYISEHHPLFARRRITRKDLEGRRVCWSDVLTRDRRALETEIFVASKHPLMEIGAYTNHLHAALLVLQSGAAVVPLPVEFMEAQALGFKVRALDSALRPYEVQLTAVYREASVKASPPAALLVDQLVDCKVQQRR